MASSNWFNHHFFVLPIHQKQWILPDCVIVQTSFWCQRKFHYFFIRMTCGRLHFPQRHLNISTPVPKLTINKEMPRSLFLQPKWKLRVDPVAILPVELCALILLSTKKKTFKYEIYICIIPMFLCQLKTYRRFWGGDRSCHCVNCAIFS